MPKLFRLVRRIARGGMSEVWEGATDGERGAPRRIAVKRLRPRHQADPSIRAMFADEARIARRLLHPNIVRVLGSGMADGAEYIAMEYVDGLDARDAIRRAARVGRPMPEAVALHVMAETAAALAYAHAATDEDGHPMEIVHRDVNPPNILLSRTGEVKLSDFGIARARERQTETTTGIVKGKEAFMSPEQVLGQPVDASTDVYALGATLHELCAGRPPLEGWSEVSRRILGGPLPVAPDLPPVIADLVRTCMERAPEARPSAVDVEAYARDLAARGSTADLRELLRDYVATLLDATEHGRYDDLMVLDLGPLEPEG